MEPTVDNAQLKQYANMFAQSASTLSGNYGQYVNAGLAGVNSLWEMIEGGKEGNSEQVSAGISQLSNIAISVLTMLANPEEKAASDIKATDNKITDGTSQLAEIKKANDQRIQTIIDQMKTEADKVQISIDKLKEIMGENGTIATAQKALDEKKEEIEEQKAILNNPDADLKDKKKALGKLTNISSEIKALAETINGLMAVVNSETEKVEAAATQMETLSSQGEQIITESLEQAGATVTKTSGGVITNVSRQTAEGTTEEAMGSSMVAAGTAAEATIVGAGAGAQMQENGAKLIAAGTEHLTGSAANMAHLGEQIGKWGGDFSAIGYDMQLLGTANSAALTLVGSYSMQASSVITAIGSWETITATTGELDQAITDYISALDADINPDGSELNGSEQGNTKAEQENPVYKVNKRNIKKYDEESGKYKKANLKDNKDVKFEFDSSKFKVTPFGI